MHEQAGEELDRGIKSNHKTITSAVKPEAQLDQQAIYALAQQHFPSKYM